MNRYDKVIRYILFGCLIICLAACKTVQIFPDKDGPIWKASYADEIPNDSNDTIKIVSFNIEYAIEIDQAILELQSIPKLNNADIILLQEMDTLSSKQIAKALQYNYIYIPAASDDDGLKMTGNSILSKWPIENERKIILPHLQNLNGRQRIAIAATISINQRPLHIYNVHLETFVMKRKKRTEQLDKVISVAVQNEAAHSVLIGGDFNSIFQKDIDEFVDLLKEHQFDWHSEGLGYTAKAVCNLIKPQLDHFFSKGLILLDSGKIVSSTASDHLPIWAEFVFTEQ